MLLNKNKKLKIAVNLLSLYEMTGIGVYAKNLLDNLGKIDKENTFLIFTPSKLFPEFYFNYENFKYIKIPINLNHKILRFIAQQVLLPLYLIKYKCDILFTPSIFVPALTLIKKVTTFHDLYYLNKKRFFKKIYLDLISRIACKSKKIIVISNYTKNELMRLYKISNDKIKLIYRSIPKMIPPSELEEKEIIRKFELDIKKPYFFYIGVLMPHKNIANLIKAFKVFNSKYPEFKLILAGKIIPKELDVLKLVKELDLEEKVYFPGVITEKEKVVFYKNAIGFVFPSFYEGFGLPVLEAQSLGVPVLTSNALALCEVGGDSVLYVNPYSIESIASGLEKLAIDESLRNQLRLKGYKNIERFSPYKEAQETLKTFKEL